MFDHISKHLEVRQNTPPRVVFSSLFLVFGNVVKHGLSCLIYYVKPSVSTYLPVLGAGVLCYCPIPI